MRWPCLLLLLVLIVSCRTKTSTSIVTKQNEAPLQKLLDGNYRFYHFQQVHPDQDAVQLKATAKEQHPFAAIVCCSDSRLSPEIIFDQGIGDLFVIRTAGNILSSVEMGSVEYAVEHLGVKLVLIMGHENCGALRAYVDGGENPGNIQVIVDSLEQEPEIMAVRNDNPNRLDDCVKANVYHGLKKLQQSSIIHEKLEKGEVKLVGARYDLDDQRVTIL